MARLVLSLGLTLTPTLSQRERENGGKLLLCKGEGTLLKNN